MTDRPTVLYARESTIGVSEFKNLLVDSGLGETRPVADDERLGLMISGSNLILTARLDQLGYPLIGLARCVTDFVWCCYLSELAVSASAQGMGVGRGLLNETRKELGPSVSLILASLPKAVGFYERAGMERISDTFWYQREH